MFQEGIRCELKREYVESIKHTVIAFANTIGGTVYIGISDDGSVNGVEDIDAVMERVVNSLRDTVSPDIMQFVECKAQKVEEKNVLLINVQQGTSRPYYLSTKGIRPAGVFLRQGASTVRASQSQILQLIKETGGHDYESSHSLVQELTFLKASAYFTKHKLAFYREQQRTLGLIAPDGTFTNLARLLSDQCIHTIKIALFEGRTKSIFKDRTELEGSLFEQLDAATDYLHRANRTRAHIEGFYRIDERDYPTEALREVLLNAIIHRDYSYSAPTLISIFDDRMEFLNLGGLVKGVSLEDIRLGVSAARNQQLANIFYRLHLVEAYGTGMQKINEAYADSAQKPRIEVSENAFKMTLMNVNFEKTEPVVKTPSSPYILSSGQRAERVKQLLIKKSYVTRSDVEQALGLSQATVILLLRKMVKDNSLVKEGAGKYTRYRSAESPR